MDPADQDVSWLYPPGIGSSLRHQHELFQNWMKQAGLQTLSVERIEDVKAFLKKGYPVLLATKHVEIFREKRNYVYRFPTLRNDPRFQFSGTYAYDYHTAHVVALIASVNGNGILFVDSNGGTLGILDENEVNSVMRQESKAFAVWPRQ